MHVARVVHISVRQLKITVKHCLNSVEQQFKKMWDKSNLKCKIRVRVRLCGNYILKVLVMPCKLNN